MIRDELRETNRFLNYAEAIRTLANEPGVGPIVASLLFSLCAEAGVLMKQLPCHEAIVKALEAAKFDGSEDRLQ